jgi:hypothetical protein
VSQVQTPFDDSFILTSRCTLSLFTFAIFCKYHMTFASCAQWQNGDRRPYSINGKPVGEYDELGIDHMQYFVIFAASFFLTVMDMRNFNWLQSW